MHRQAGVSKVALVAAVAVLAVGGAGFLAWQSMQQADSLRSELNKTESDFAKARAALRQAGQDLAVASKEAKDLKVVVDRLTAERDTVRVSMENEQATGVRLRAELELAREQVSYLASRSTKEIVKNMPKTVAAK
jgi:hypothetical protein